MTGSDSGVRPALFVAFAIAALAALPVVHAAVPDESQVNRVVELNKKALARYDVLDMEGAATLLREAVEVCKNGSLEGHTAAARTHLHLGVVYVSGLKHHELGLAEFRKALAIDPGLRISKSLSNPEVEAAFAEAQAVPPLQSAAGRALPFPIGQDLPPVDRHAAAEMLVHPRVTTAVRDLPVTLKVQLSPGLGATKIVLAYRAEHGDEFLARDMLPVEGSSSWYRAEIPAAATHGNWVVYYIEVQRDDDQLIAHSGSPDEPHRVALASPPGEGSLRGKHERPARLGAGRGGGLWFVLAAGTGGGYHRGSPEMNPHDLSVPPKELRVSGFGPAQMFHLAPELGYFQTDRLVLSAQGRFQFVGGAQDFDIDGKTFKAARMAFAVFAKATWLLRTSSRRLQPIFFGQLGAGQIRHSVETPAGANLPYCMAANNGPCRDTVLGGLAFAGGGLGATYAIVGHVGLYGALTVLAGAPHLMVEADLNVGIALTY